MSNTELRLGWGLDAGLIPTGQEMTIDLRALLDHALIVGARGSGKTSLVIELVEALVATKCSVLVLDTSGEISNELQVRTGSSPQAGFADTARPVDPRIQLNVVELDSASRMFDRPILGEPGSEAWSKQAHDLSRAVLDLLGYRVRGLTPELALLESIVFNAWEEGVDLSFEQLIPLVREPRIGRIGLFELESVVSQKRRQELSASLATFLDISHVGGPAATPIDIGALVTQPDGSPAAAVISFEVSSSDVRRFLAAVVWAHLTTYVSSTNRSVPLVVILDEAHTFIPPNDRVITTDGILAAMDTWSAFNVGIVLVSSDPSEVADVAADRVGTWIVGRFPAAQARGQIVAELDLVNPPINEVVLDECLKSMAVGQFVLKSLRYPTLVYLQTEITGRLP